MRTYGVRSFSAILVTGALLLPVAAAASPAASGARPKALGTQIAELKASDAATQACFGASVAVSGGTAVAGSPCSLAQNGKIYVFNLSGSGWKQAAEMGSTNPGRGLFDEDHFGSSVAISGSTLVAGAWGYADYTNQRFGGAAEVFSKTASGWIKTAVLSGLNSTDDEFGYSVAISGNTIVVGDPTYADGSGRAYVFTKTTSGWQETAELWGADNASGGSGYWPEFGESVGVSANTVFVGSLDPAPQDEWAGRVYVFTKAASGWQQVAELKGSDTVAGDAFGRSIALTRTTAIVGAPYHASMSKRPNVGAAYVFSYTPSGWKQTAELKGADTAGDSQFGISTALSGTVAVVGANNALSSGRAYVFSKVPAGWKQVGELKGTDTSAHDQLGFSVGVSGVTAIVGAPDHAKVSGRAYVFTV